MPYPADRKHVVAGELEKLTNNADHKRSVELLGQVFGTVRRETIPKTPRKPRRKRQGV